MTQEKNLSSLSPLEACNLQLGGWAYLVTLANHGCVDFRIDISSHLSSTSILGCFLVGQSLISWLGEWLHVQFISWRMI